MKNFTIPKTVQLFGETIEVRWEKNLVSNQDDVGQAHYRTNMILLQPSTDALPRPRSSIEVTYLHELLHFIMNQIAHSDEEKNSEDFIDLLAGVLHQVLITAEGELE